MCFWKCYNFRKFSGHVKLSSPRPPLPDFPITSVSGPGVTMLLVTPLLLMNMITSRQWKVRIGMCKRVKHPTIKEHTLLILPPKFLATSRWAPSSLLAVVYWRGSWSNGWSLGSKPTSQHTSLKRLAVKSQTSLWRMDGNPPHGQLKACTHAPADFVIIAIVIAS